MSYSATDTVRALRDLGRDGAGGLTITRWDHEGSGERDETAEQLFRELLVEDVTSYSNDELGKALVDELRSGGLLP
jgi:hypothetical protein